MALADFTRVKKSVIALINANPGAYASTVSGKVGRFPSDDEIRDAILKRDAELNIAALETSNHWHRASFTPTLSSPLANGAPLPAAQGAVSDVRYSTDGLTYLVSKLANNKDEVLQAIEFATTVYGSSLTDVAGFHWLEDNRLFHSSPYAKVNYYTFTIGASPQSPDVWEDALTHGAAATLQKDGGAQPELFQVSEQKFQNKINEIRSFPHVLPETTAAAKASE